MARASAQLTGGLEPSLGPRQVVPVGAGAVGRKDREHGLAADRGGGFLGLHPPDIDLRTALRIPLRRAVAVVVAGDEDDAIRIERAIGLRHGQQVAGVEGDDRRHAGHLVQGGGGGEALGDQQRSRLLEVRR